MSPGGFASRATRDELMDDPGVPLAEMARALDELALINRLLGGYATSLGGLAALLGDVASGATITVLDVGAGGADVGGRAVRWARRRGVDLRWVALDRSPSALRAARERLTTEEGIEFLEGDLLELDHPPRSFDVVHASLVLHHFTGDATTRAVAAMHRLARRGVVINDLHRHPLAWGSIALLTRLFSRSRLVRHDAPLSVRRAFRRADWSRLAEDADVPTPSVRWRWAFRWQVTIPRGGES